MSIAKEQYLVTETEQINHDILLNEVVPARIESDLTSCLVVKKAPFYPEKQVKAEYLQQYKKNYDDFLPRLQGVLFYNQVEPGVYERADLQRIVDSSNRGFGRDYRRMTAD